MDKTPPGCSCSTCLARAGQIVVFGTQVLFVSLYAGSSVAEEQAACPSPPGSPTSGNRVLCEADASSDRNIHIDFNGFPASPPQQPSLPRDITIDIDFDGFHIVTHEEGQHGVEGIHSGTGDVNINTKDSGSNTPDIDIETHGRAAHGIHGSHKSTGKVGIKATDIDIKTSGHSARGIDGSHEGTGKIDITVRGGSIETSNVWGYGIFGESRKDGDVSIDVKDNAEIETLGGHSSGIYGVQRGGHLLKIDVLDSKIVTHKVNSWGIQALHSGAGDIRIHLGGGSLETKFDDAPGTYVRHGGTGVLGISTKDAAITTRGKRSHGLFGFTFGGGPGPSVDLDVNGGSINTEDFNSIGVLGSMQVRSGTGDIDIDVAGASIETAGVSAPGVYGINSGTANTGNISIALKESPSITTSGAKSHGVYARHISGKGVIAVTIGSGTIQASGQGSSGVRIGSFDAQTRALSGVAEVGPGGYRAQRVTVGRTAGATTARAGQQTTSTVNSEMVRGGSGDAAGVYLAGGGKVVIRGDGSLGAASGTAIHAARKLESEPAPNLHVALYPNGRPISDLLRGRIVNDGGRTVVTVHDKELFVSDDFDEDGNKKPDSPTRWAPNGAKDVALASDFRPDHDPSSDTVKMEFQLAESYIHRDRPKPTPRRVTRPKPKPLPKPDPKLVPRTAPKPVPGDGLLKKYAPRAAVYEALPDFLLGLDGGGNAGGRLSAPDSPAWIRVSGGNGAYRPVAASVGARSDCRHHAGTAGLDIPLPGGLTLGLGLHRVSATADVSATTGGGEIRVEGRGLSGTLAWEDGSGFHATAGVTSTRHDVDLSSSERGMLAREAGASAMGWVAEAGRRFARTDGTDFTVRGWLERSELSMEGLTDTTGAHLSLADAERTAAGVGVAGRTVRVMGEGRLSLGGALGVERRLSSGTAVLVSGERLESRGPDTRLLVDLGMEYRTGNLVFAAGLSADGPGSGSRRVSGEIRLSYHF